MAALPGPGREKRKALRVLARASQKTPVTTTVSTGA